MNNKVLIIFKYPRGNWNPPIINKFSNYYDTEHLYVSDYHDKNFTEIIQNINSVIETKKIDIVVFDVDYFKFINLFFIEKINCKKKILITGDDFELHELNSITASSCDIVLSHCPLSVLKYREKGFEAYNIHFESGKVKDNDSVQKEIDVLFFGNITSDRKEILNYITDSGIKIKNIGYEEATHGVSEKELLEHVSKSKIVLNLSKSRSQSVKNYSGENIYKFFYQFKGRILIAGLNGALCVSEYSPGQEIIFNENEVPSFYTKEECVNVLKKLLNDKNLLLNCKNKFVKKVVNLCEDKKNFEPIYNVLRKDNHRKVKIIKIPYWYLRISAKQIILRNMKLSTFIKSLLQFKIILRIIKNSNFIVKFLIISEYIINVFWYSFVLTFKSK
tara:strand:- start:9133 stop:10299 length:1167 start_codon:yes stop_codon:yes gene_type:complete